MTATPLGAYLDEALFLNPAFKLRAEIGRQAAVPADIRIVMADDATLKVLGRQPTFSEWVAVANVLFREGFDRVLLQEPQDLESSLGNLSEVEAPGSDARGDAQLVVGIVGTSASKSNRLIDPSEMPPEYGIRSVDGLAAFQRAERFLVPAAAAFPFIDALAINNLDPVSTSQVPAAMSASDGRIYPQIGLLADRALTRKNGVLHGSQGIVHTTGDGKLYVNFVSMSSIVARSLPLRVFFDQASGTPKAGGPLRADVAERLKGGRVAILLTGAYSGARTTVSPVEGTVPAYLNLLSVATSVLTGVYVAPPVAPWLPVWMLIPILFFGLKNRRTQVAIGIGVGVLIVAVVGGLAAFEAFGFFLPVASIVSVTSSAVLVRSLNHLLVTVRDNSKLQHELSLGRTVQQTLLPTVRHARVGAWEYFVVYRPYGAMAGDWYQVHASSDGLGVVAIGDVVGKGASAALITATIAGLWQAEAKSWRLGSVDVQAFVGRLSDSIYKVFKGQQNSTLCLAVLGASDIELYRAAAPKWLRLAANGESELLRQKSSNGLGMAAESVFVTPTKVTASTGDVFVAYSDGVMEAPGTVRHFTTSLRTLDFGSPDVLSALETLALETSKLEGANDDVTLLALRYVGGP